LTNSANATASSAKVEKLETSEFREVDAHFTREEDDYRLEDAHDRVKKHTHTLEVILIQENPSCNNVNDTLLLLTAGMLTYPNNDDERQFGHVKTPQNFRGECYNIRNKFGMKLNPLKTQ
jgi:hypothetical protein